MQGDYLKRPQSLLRFDTVAEGGIQVNREATTRWLVPVLSLTGMLSSLQFTLFLPTLPEIPAALSVSANDATWVITVTLLTSTAGGPVIGRLADLYGKRRVLLVSMVLLVLGSLIGALGATFVAVVVGRALQGLAATVIPLGISILREALGREKSNSGIGFMSATVGIGSALGLPLSGILYGLGGLTAIFWFSAVSGLIVLALVFFVTPHSPDSYDGRFDVSGAILLSILLTAVLIAISKGLVWGLGSTSFFTVLAVIGVTLPLWLARSFTTSEPIVDLRLSFSGPVVLINTSSFFVSFGMFANHFLTIHEARAPSGTVIGLGLPAITAGLILLPATLALITLAPIAGKLINRFGGKFTLALGSTIIAGAYVFRLVAHEGVVIVTVGAFLVGVGSAFAFTAMPTLINDAVPVHQLASANSINTVARSLSGSIVSAILAFLIVATPNPVDSDFISQWGLMLSFGVTATLALASVTLTLALPKQSHT